MTSSENDAELIAYLRLQGLDKDIAAADRIEALVKERDRAWQEADAWGGKYGWAVRDKEAAEAKLAECEAQLGKAVKALEWFRSPAFIQGPSPIDCLQTGIYKANATLAAIKGESHE